MDNFKLSWGLLEKNNRKKFVLIIFLFIVLSLLEVLGIASVIPFITAIFNPEILNSFQFINKYSEILEKKRDLILRLEIKLLVNKRLYLPGLVLLSQEV